jgi:tetratricopeptide (TPR) repeat protein
VQKLVRNISYVPALLLLVIVIGGQACTSKRMARQAQKLEEEGLYEIAAENYLRSFRANPNNIEAATGLRRTGQRTLESKAELVSQAWFSGNDRETVYKYLDALEYLQRIRATGIELTMPPQAASHYEEARPRFLDSMFEEARLLLDEENFSLAESMFSEILRIDPSYLDLSHYLRISRSEPLYRVGVDQLSSGFYRRAYHTFSNLIDNHGSYKDARELRDDALSKGMLTIAISEFENTTRLRNAHNIIKSRIAAELSNMNNPFIQIVDDRNLDAFLRKQEVAARLGSEIKIGRLMAVKALLTGKLTSFEVREGRLQSTERKAYLKEVIETEDNVTREKSSKTIYHKVTFYEYRRENKASGTFHYQLSSTETGAVLVSGVAELSAGDQVHYAVFDGETENIVPGHWENIDRDSPKDNIRDEPKQIREMQNLFEARQDIKTADMLRNELTGGIALAVSEAVNAYNPEQ